MFQKLLSSSVAQYGTIARLSARDTATAVGSVLLVCAMVWYVGHPVVATVVALSILVFETALRAVFKRKGPFQGFSRRQIILTALIIHVVNIILYTTPPLFLASHPSLAVKITGLLCLVGMQVYVTNTWSRVPLFLGAQLGPVILMLVVAMLQLGTTEPTSSPMIHWGFAFAFMFTFIFMTIDTLRQQIVTERALDEAQRDVSDRMAQLEEAHRLDGLTGLLNRPAFDTALNVMLQDRQISGGEVAVFLADLDSFKPINDTYSHEAGDRVLIETAQRLTRYVGDRGIVGRLGGDEFICAVEGLSGLEDAIQFGRELTTAIAGEIAWSARMLKVGSSIGIAMTGDGPPAPHASVSALCSAADQAMFAAKSSPNGGPIVYEAHLFAPRMSSEDKQLLVESIKNASLKPYYQPKIHLPTGQIIGFEALARWEHPTRGCLLPTHFLDQINELGLQGDFMISIANQVVQDVTALLAAGLDPGQVSFNVPEVALATYTGRQDLHRIVAAHPDAARHLTFEITEDVFIARAADTIQSSIATFRALGVRISLDDFGTGFASFHHLRQLDFDELKIDTSFVAGLGHDATSEVLVRGFLSIASGLGVSVIAEGVETEAQSRDLMNMGCLSAQGYLFSAAVPVNRATDMLSAQHAA